MDIFCPISSFIKVDLPTLVRPIMPIKPDLNPAGAWGIITPPKSVKILLLSILETCDSTCIVYSYD